MKCIKISKADVLKKGTENFENNFVKLLEKISVPENLKKNKK